MRDLVSNGREAESNRTSDILVEPFGDSAHDVDVETHKFAPVPISEWRGLLTDSDDHLAVCLDLVEGSGIGCSRESQAMTCRVITQEEHHDAS